MKNLLKIVACGLMIAFIAPVHAGSSNPETRADAEFELKADKGFQVAARIYFRGKNEAAFIAGVNACTSKLEVLQRYSVRDSTYSVPTHDHTKTYALSKTYGNIQITYTKATDKYLCQGV
jgi:hypothetical protein